MKEADKTENKTKKIEKYAKNEEKSKNYTTQSTYYFVDEHTYLIRKKKKTEHKKEKKTTTRNSRFIKSLFGNFEKRLHLLYFSFFFLDKLCFFPPSFYSSSLYIFICLNAT